MDQTVSGYVKTPNALAALMSQQEERPNCPHNDFLMLDRPFRLDPPGPARLTGRLKGTWASVARGRTNLFSLQGRYRVPEAVKAVFDVVPTLALQCIVVCPFVCL